MRRTVLIQSFSEVNMSSYILPIITVYNNPADFPEKFVARLWDVDQHTPYALVKDDLPAIRSLIPSGFHNIGREPGDDPAICEVWVWTPGH